MPLFLVERHFAEQLHLSSDEVSRITRIKSETGVNWLYSFLSADKKRTYCVYEAASAEVFKELATKLGSPVGDIIELSEIMSPPRAQPLDQTD